MFEGNVGGLLGNRDMQFDSQGTLFGVRNLGKNQGIFEDTSLKEV